MNLFVGYPCPIQHITIQYFIDPDATEAIYASLGKVLLKLRVWRLGIDLACLSAAQKSPLKRTKQCRSKGNITGGARKRRRREPLGGSGGMLPQKNLKSRDLEMLFPVFSKSYL